MGGSRGGAIGVSAPHYFTLHTELNILKYRTLYLSLLSRVKCAPLTKEPSLQAPQPAKLV